MTPLADDFVPGPDDVICCRGKRARMHSGNIKFKNLIKDKLHDYSRAISKLKKSNIVKSIVGKVREGNPNGGFVKEKSGIWYEVGNHLAREKVGQSLRDSLHLKYRSSSESKKRRRLEEQAKIDYDLEEIVQAHSQETLNNIGKISVDSTDDDIQAILNIANCRLLQTLKKREEKEMNEIKKRRILRIKI